MRLAGSVWGVIAVEDTIQAEALLAAPRHFGVSEITEDEYVASIQKKSKLDMNVVRYNGAKPAGRAAHVEVKNGGETSSDVNVESVDELLSAPTPEPTLEPTPQPAPKPKTRRRSTKKARTSKSK